MTTGDIITIQFMILSILFFVSLYLSIRFTEALYRFRKVINNSPYLGYYSKLNWVEYLAMNYLLNKCELKYEKLLQGGYNIVPYKYGE